MREVCIIGLGYIGLPTAAMFATHGIKVRGVDIRQDICEAINRGDIRVVEPYLAELIKQVVAQGMIHCSTEVKPAEAHIIAVPTPITPDKGADLSYVVDAGRAVAKVLRRGDLVILESTVSPRCTADILRPALEESGLKAGEDFFLAYCPERVLPGQIIHELERNNRIVGGFTPASAAKAKELYSAFVRGEIYLTDTVTAEMCKLMENTYRDVNIALANELARLCEKLGCNAWEVIKYANKHPRVNLHSPGPGVGGHCLAVDPWFIVESEPEIARIIALARTTNDEMPRHVLDRVRLILPGGGRVVLLGCSYKPDIDDVRESPSLALYSLLEECSGYNAALLDPYVPEYARDIYDALTGADLMVLAVHHRQFASLDLRRIRSVMRTPNVLDTRNFLRRGEVEAAGLTYHLLGEGPLAK